MAFKAKPRSEMNTSDCSANQQEDQKVDILECESPNDEFQEEEEVLCQSSSSSFGDSMFARDDDDNDDSGFEAQSMLSKDYPLPATCGDGTDFLGLRKKKLTDEWRRFCQPLMWRCKWLELKVKEIESQARGYEKEVRSYYLSKQFDLEKSKLEGFDGKSIPFRDQSERMSVFKRGRRKRVEETTDVAAYVSSHNVLSYAEKRKPTTLKAQYPDPDFGAGLKATGKEDEIEDDYYISECSDDLLAKILCKIDEAQDKAKRLKKRVDQLMSVSQAGHTSSLPRTVAPSRSDFKQHALVEEEPLMPHTAAHSQKEATVQIRRQRISADHTEDLLISQAPPFETDGQFLYNNSPVSYGGLRFPSIEDLPMMVEPEMNGYEGEPDKDLAHCFLKLMNKFEGKTLSEDGDEEEEEEEDEEEEDEEEEEEEEEDEEEEDEDEEEEEEDPTPVTKRHKTSY